MEAENSNQLLPAARRKGALGDRKRRLDGQRRMCAQNMGRKDRPRST